MMKLNVGASLLFVKIMAHATLTSEGGAAFASWVPCVGGIVLVLASVALACAVREILPIDGPSQIE